MTAAKPPSDEAITKALAAQGELTSAELAATAGLGRSTVTKTLAALERAGKVRRRPGGSEGGRRLPDRWSLAPSGQRGPNAGSSSTERLRPGQLNGLVLDFLNTHDRDASLGITAVAKGLGRSAGAIGNCLSRLVAAGRVRQVGDHPRRYRTAVSRSSAPNTTPREEEP